MSDERVAIMPTEDTLWAMEERFWTQGADSARTMTAKGAVFVFPYPGGHPEGRRYLARGSRRTAMALCRIFRAVVQPGSGHLRARLLRLCRA